MIQFEKLRFHDKNGYDLNLTPTSELLLKVTSSSGSDAVIYPYINLDGSITNSLVISGGFSYGSFTALPNGSAVDNPDVVTVEMYENERLIYTLLPNQYNITFKRCTVSNGSDTDNVLSIESVNFTGLTKKLVNCTAAFPSITFTGAIYIKETSVDLVETETIFISEEYTVNSEPAIKRPVITDCELMLSSLGDNDDNIKFFSIKDDHSIVWSKYLLFSDLDTHNTDPLAVNVGFRALDEGVYETILNLYVKKGTDIYNFGQIIVSAVAVGCDERFKTLIDNFALPSMERCEHLFKESSICEDMIDYQLVNEKSKLLLLEYQNIFSYVGSYKALINAIKFFGYDDIFFKEWFFNCNTLTDESYTVTYNAKNRLDTILKFNLEQRKSLKKLNKLTMVYSINQIVEGEFEDDMTPVVESSYAYTADEIKVKLHSLREWLQEHIIGVNCRITDITGEGIYFEAFKNLILPSQVSTINIDSSLNLTPMVKRTSFDRHDKAPIMVDLTPDGAILPLTFKEVGETLNLDDMDISFEDLGDATAEAPITGIKECVWNAHVSTDSCVIGEISGEKWGVDEPLLILDNSIRFYNPQKERSKFICGYKKLSMSLEQCELINTTNKKVNKLSLERYIAPVEQHDVFVYNEASGDFDKTLSNQSTYRTRFKFDYYVGDTLNTVRDNDYMYIYTEDTTIFEYKYLPDFYGFVLVISNFKLMFGGTFIEMPDEYVLNIIDGNIIIDHNNVPNIICFNYDNKGAEQSIRVNVTYSTGIVDMVDSAGDIKHEFELQVNHAGKYEIECIAWNEYNNAIKMKVNDVINVIDVANECSVMISGDAINIDAKEPLYDRPRELYGLSPILASNKDNYLSFKMNSIYYSLPEKNSLVKLIYNGVEGEDLNQTYTVSSHQTTTSRDKTKIMVNTPDSFEVGDVVLVEFNAGSQIMNSSTYRILARDNSSLTINNNVPKTPTSISRAWKEPCELFFKLKDSFEVDNSLNIKLHDDNLIYYYLDRHFACNIYPFDITKLKEIWLQSFTGDGNNRTNVTLNQSTGVAFIPKSFEVARRNIWKLKNESTDEYIAILNNSDTIAMTISEPGIYSLELTSYDRYGNASKIKRNGIIELI